jgi:hypothetical protein
VYFKLLLSAVLSLAASALWAAEAARVVFVAGTVKVAEREARVGDIVQEGEQLRTGPQSYLYLATLDKGFLILRPNSSGQIVTYQIDPGNPANSRIKIELQSGVARHISGDAVKSARQNFRFNTPVAAVGVRGTDFTVFADQQTTRITVLTGGVVISPLTGACAAAGFGPCEGPASRELFANNLGQMLQIGRGQVPELLQGTINSPDVIAPPRPDEPAASKTGARNMPAANNAVVAANLNLDSLKTNAITQSSLLNLVMPVAAPPQTLPQLTVPVAAPPQTLPQLTVPVAAPPQTIPQLTVPVAAPPQLIWGRWQTVLDQSVEVDVAAFMASHQMVATNAYFALMRNREAQWQPPPQASLGFALQQSQAVIFNEASRQLGPAKIENGELQIDFAQASFFTKFEVVSQNERIVLQNKGEVAPDGKLYGGSQFSRPNNMDVRGALATDNRSAVYLFQSRLDALRVASGATLWGR